MKKIALLASLLLAALYAVAQDRVVPYTQADRDRLVRVEARLDEFQKAVDQRFQDQQRVMDQRFEAVEKRLDTMQSTILTLMSLTIGLVVALFGYIVWDRRTTLAPLERELKMQSERLERVENRTKLIT